MLTQSKQKVVPREFQDLPEVDYPDEVIARWDKIVEVTRMQLATGEIRAFNNTGDMIRFLARVPRI